MKPLELGAVVKIMSGRWVAPGAPPHTLVADVSTDTRSLSGNPLFVALRGDRFDAHQFVAEAKRRGAVASVVAERALETLPKGAGPYVVVDDPLSAIERLAKWNRDRLNMTVVAITGSVGKTSTKEFLATLLRERFQVTAAPKSYNNRIGVAMTLVAAGRHTEVLLTELGTSRPGELSHLSRLVRPDVVVVTEIAAAHLEGLRDLSGVVAAKAEIFDGIAPDGRAHLRRGMMGFETFRRCVPGKVSTFGSCEAGSWSVVGAGRDGTDYLVTDCRQVALGDPRSVDGCRAYGYHFTINGRENFLLPVPGRHNVLNAVAAMSVARELGMSITELRAALVFCRLPPLRLEVVDVQGVLFVNDCYNASPRSMQAAIEEWRGLAHGGSAARTCSGRRNGVAVSSEAAASSAGGPVAVLGDMLELGEKSRELHAEVGVVLAETDLRLLVTVGDHSRWIQAAYRARGGRGDTRHFESALEAVTFLKRAIRSGDRVLLKGSRKIGLERVFKELHRWVKLSGGRRLNGTNLEKREEY